MSRKFLWLLISGLGVSGCFYHPADSTVALSEEALGKMLFFDPILSQNKTASCASCHIPDFAFADTVAFSKGSNGRFTRRNTPSAMNVAGRPYLFWDGRSPNLEDQVLHPIANPDEMGFSIPEVIKRLNQNKRYTEAFTYVYGKTANAELLGKAIAAYERTLESGDSPFDRFVEGDSSAISASAMRGLGIFTGKGHCFDCHFSPDFTGDEFRNIGLFNGKDLNDSGRYYVTHQTGDIGKFKVPGLRNAALTAPYMHNGMFRTLKSVVDFYNNPELFTDDAQGTDSLIKPLNLTEQEKADLVSFLESLTSSELIK